MTRTNHTAYRLLLCLTLAITASLCSQHAIVLGQTDAKEPAAVEPVMLEQSPAEAQIEAALLEQTSLEFVETRLSDVVLYLSEQHNIPITLDMRGLDQEGIYSDQPITLAVKGIQLRSALRLMLQEWDLTYRIHEGALQITSTEQARRSLVTHTYAVRDLMKSAYHADQLDPEALTTLLQRTVAPASWNPVGGPGSVAPFNGALIISQTPEVQRQVQALLTQLRRVAHALEHDPQRAFDMTWNTAQVGRTETERKIIAALDQIAPKVEFIETPLNEAIAYLQEELKFPILLDKRGLESIGVPPDQNVTKNLKGVTLHYLLNDMLSEWELTFVVRDEVLWITPHEEAERHTPTSLFVVRDLLASPGTAHADSRALRELIMQTIAPNSWDEVGGPGNIRYFKSLDILVVSQTTEVLDQVEHLLAKLRKVRQAQEPWSAEAWAEQREVFLSTSRFETFGIQRDLNGDLAVEPATVVHFLQNALDKSLQEKAKLKVSQNSIHMFLTPRELDTVQRLLERAGLPVTRSAKFNVVHGFGSHPSSGGVNSDGEGGFF